MAELHELTALEQASAIRAGEFSSLELTDHYLERSERLGDQVGAFVRLLPDAARAQAAAADAAIRAGATVGPLHGVVVPIKDLTGVSGIPSTYGSVVPMPIPEQDDHVVARLRDAGVVFSGKTNTPEFGLPCYTENDLVPPARTPWDPSRSAGGSSGGAAAAVAAGLASVAQGNDGGGSIRIPASVCGLVGIKPSRYRVCNGPWPDGVGELGVQGPLARTVRDAAALLDAMTGACDDSPVLLAAESFLAAADRSPTRLRIGRYCEPVIIATELDEQSRAGYEFVSGLLSDLGHEVVETEPPFGHDVLPLFEKLWTAGAAGIPIPAEHERELRPLTRWLRQRGNDLSGPELVAAVASIRAMSRRALAASARFDVVLTPTLAKVPAFVGQLRDDLDPAADFYAQCAYTPFTSPYNVTGQPAVSLPVYWTAENLPIGVQLVGRPGAEALLVSLAAQLEANAPWAGRRPVIW